MNFIVTFLGKCTNRFLGSMESDVSGISGNGKNNDWLDILKVLVRLIDQFLPVAMILLGLVGSIYAIVVGVRYAKAENEEQKNEAKKKLINAAIGILIGLILMITMWAFLKNSSAIATWLTDATGEA